MTDAPAAKALLGVKRLRGPAPRSMVPPSGVRRPLRQPIRVDLPDPFGPSRAWISPSAMSRSTPSSASSPPNAFDNSLTWSGTVPSSVSRVLVPLGVFVGREELVDQPGVAKLDQRRCQLGVFLLVTFLPSTFESAFGQIHAFFAQFGDVER